MATKIKIGNERKRCGLCGTHVDELQYRAHVAQCGLEAEKHDVKPAMKLCALCQRHVTDLVKHYEICTGGNNTTLGVCTERTNSPVPSRPQYPRTSVVDKKATKDCPFCSRMIAAAEYLNHVDVCFTQLSGKPAKPEESKECPVCLRGIPAAEYSDHVNDCLTRSPERSNSHSKPRPKPTTRTVEFSCFTCSTPVNPSKRSSHTIPCRSSHIYCLTCLQHSTNEHIQNKTAPICHSALCDYELSRYDVACLPLEAENIQRLLPCVKSTRRAQCPLCLFYVDFNTMNDLQNHAASCSSENFIPCECCSCLCNIHRLDSHLRQCRNASSFERQQALIDYIVPRTKYPFTTQQMHTFLNYRKNKHLPLDPHSVVDALAEFGEVFPLEVETFECVMCMDAFVYDDVFVIGCKEYHKLCYGCFERSCYTQMTSNAILACPTCAYHLQQGEVEQLRVSTDRKKEFAEYQLQKLFRVYADGTKRVIKCPNQECKWIAEAENLNDRFQVKCRLCAYEFCSLCSRQYHFRTTCQQIPEITQRWFFWCNTERGNYWQARAQQDANFRAQLEDYERQQAANVQRNQELRQRYDELLNDEDLKSKSCRLCPNCQRVVEHLGGCNSMICGDNYHRGNQQFGCGHRFDWAQATPYVPIVNTGPEQVQNDRPAPEQQQHVVHTNVHCDACHNEIQGIRFDCVHCASVIFCEKCEQRATLQHSNQNRDDNKQQHVFQLITSP